MPFDANPEPLLPQADQRQRLLQLCRVLERVSDSSFDLRDWSRSSLCRTVSCAVGWATRDPWFRAQGLGREEGSPAFGEDRGWTAVRRFFGLSKDEALYLFHQASYGHATREAVMARIRDFAERT
jgi:hypothetical protein